MSAQTAAEMLDQLDALRAAGTPGSWGIDEGTLRHIDAEDQDGLAETLDAADAALIVAAVNALPQLTAAIRAVLDLALDFDGDSAHWGPEWGQAADRIREAVSEALRAAADAAEEGA